MKTVPLVVVATEVWENILQEQVGILKARVKEGTATEAGLYHT